MKKMNNFKKLEKMGYTMDMPTKQMVLPSFYEPCFKYEHICRTQSIKSAPNYPTVLDYLDVRNMKEKDFIKLKKAMVQIPSHS